MEIRLFRMNGAPALTEHMENFKKEWQAGYDNLVKNLGTFQEADEDGKKEWPKLLDALEKELFLKYPRENVLKLETLEDFQSAVERYGALSFCFEEVGEKKVERLTCYILDPLPA